MIGDRILIRLALLGKSQSWLARQVGLRQPTINALVRGTSQSSVHLHKIARALGTTVDYLTGETDDPDENAPPPAPAGATAIMMPMVLPPTPALKRMFDGMLKLVDQGATSDEQALQLAEMLPIALSRVRDLHFGSPGHLVPIEPTASDDAVPATAHPVSTR